MVVVYPALFFRRIQFFFEGGGWARQNIGNGKALKFGISKQNLDIYERNLRENASLPWQAPYAYIFLRRVNENAQFLQFYKS